MFTIFHVVELGGGLLGMLSGGLTAAHLLGWPAGLLEGVLGAVLGFLFGRVPGVIATRAVFRDLRRKPPEELRGLVQRGVWPAYHLVLGELVRRGEDVAGEFAFVHALLVADDPVKRYQGLVNLELYYPALAVRMPDYRPEEAAEPCRAKVQRAGLLGS
jgi:hypothetical protein